MAALGVSHRDLCRWEIFPPPAAHETGDMVMIARAENLLGDIDHSVGHADAAREQTTAAVTDWLSTQVGGSPTAEVVDLRTLSPLDVSTLAGSRGERAITIRPARSIGACAG